MTDMAKTAGTITGGVVGVLVIAVSFFGRGSPELAERVQTYLETVDAQSPAERHRNVADQVHTLEEFTKDADFSRLAPNKRQAVKDRLAELTAYQGYADAVNRIPSPAKARTGSELRAIQEQLAAVKVPVAYQVEWSQTAAGVRQRHLLDSFLAMERAIASVELSYQGLCEQAQALRNNSESPNLPGRAKKILAEAARLPTPETYGNKLVPGSEDVSYAAVFAFDRVADVYGQWVKESDLLKRLAELGK